MTLQFSTIVFILLLIILFHILPAFLRKYLLLLASAAFIYAEGGMSSLLVLAAITVLSWSAGLFYPGKRAGGKSNKLLTIVSIAILAFILFGWKYIPLLLPLPDGEGASPFAIPIGLSFYTFQAISYIADLYTSKVTGEKNFFKYALYMMWFPKWMSGPIERSKDFLSQVEVCGNTKLLDFERFKKAAAYLIWGMFMKLVIADRIAIVVDSVFADINSFGFLAIILASLFYTLQIYCDFAGYTNSMIGISAMFGLELTQNFKNPYFSESTVEFWRKWHVSLSNFLRDYIYIPLGGNRKGNTRKMLNTLVVFFVCGMWHGAGLSFIVWGLLHGIFNIVTNLIKDTKAKFLVKGATGRLVTFCLVSFAWIFFRASTLHEALIFIKGMIPGINSLSPTEGFAEVESLIMGISRMEWWIAVLAIALLAIFDYITSRQKTIPPEMILTKWGDFSRGIFLAVITVVILIFGKYGSGEAIRAFVYQSF